jgi:hypothetical protein
MAVYRINAVRGRRTPYFFYAFYPNKFGIPKNKRTFVVPFFWILLILTLKSIAYVYERVFNCREKARDFRTVREV